MKATVDRAELQEAVGWLHNVVGDRVPLPYVGNVRIDVADDEILLWGANFERGGMCQVPAICEGTGHAIVNLKRLHEACGLGDKVSLETEGHSLHLSTDVSRFELGLLDEPPPEMRVDAPPPDQEVLHGDDVAAALRAAYSATGAAYEYSKVIRAVVGNEGVQFGGTDDARVHLALHGECELKDMEGYRLLSARDAEIIAKTVKGQDTSIGVGSSEVSFHTDDRVLTVRTVDMPYRDLSVPFGLAVDSVVTVDAGALEQAIKTAAPFDANRERPQVLIAAKDTDTLTVGASSEGEQGSVDVPCAVRGGGPESARLKSIARYLTDALRHCDGEVDLSIAPGRACYVEGGNVLCMVGGIKEGV